MRYQRAVVVQYDRREDLLLDLQYNLDEYLKSCRVGEPVALQEGAFLYRVVATPTVHGDVERFARKVIWSGRKGGKFLYPVQRVQADVLTSPA